jgi:hypothetical protein
VIGAPACRYMPCQTGAGWVVIGVATVCGTASCQWHLHVLHAQHGALLRSRRTGTVRPCDMLDWARVYVYTHIYIAIAIAIGGCTRGYGCCALRSVTATGGLRRATFLALKVSAFHDHLPLNIDRQTDKNRVCAAPPCVCRNPRTVQVTKQEQQAGTAWPSGETY